MKNFITIFLILLMAGVVVMMAACFGGVKGLIVAGVMVTMCAPVLLHPVK